MKNPIKSTFFPPEDGKINALTGRETTVFPSIASTNSALTDAIRRGKRERDGICVACSQSAGKGRLGRSFCSEVGGIYFSFNFKIPTKSAPATAHLVTPLAGVAVTSTLEELYGLRLGLKWVNDVIADGKKLCGILTEAVTVGDDTFIVVGIGINAVNEDFPDTATSLSRLGVEKIDASEVISAIVNEFFARLPRIDEIHLDYRARLCHLACPVTVHRFDGSEDEGAECLDVNEDCELKVRYLDGRISVLSSGEVSVKIN